MDDSKPEVLYTLTSIRNIRAKVDRSELVTVQKARELGMSWTEIATALGVTRQAAWERLHEMDPAPASSPIATKAVRGGSDQHSA
jgi:hypothetical protein